MTLRLYGHLNNTNTASLTIQVFNVTSNTWQESTINYNNKPASQAGVLASANVTGTTNQYYEWDLTQHILGLRNTGATLVSLLVKSFTAANNNLVVFNSKEATANKPELRISTPSARILSAGDKIRSAEDQLIPQYSFTAYPNPASNSVTLKYPREFNNKKLQIMDISGRRVKELLLTGLYSQSIMLDNIPTGLYVLYIECNGQKYLQKLIIKK